jgi:hypothetical protein
MFSYTMRKDGLFRIQSELVSTAISTDFALPPQQQQQTNLPSTSQHLPQTTCASFLINRLLNDREDGNQQPPFSPEFELDNWSDNETKNTDRDDEDDDDDDDDDNDNDDITDYVDLCSKRAINSLDIL